MFPCSLLAVFQGAEMINLDLIDYGLQGMTFSPTEVELMHMWYKGSEKAEKFQNQKKTKYKSDLYSQRFQ